jgi:hypothetical protein
MSRLDVVMNEGNQAVHPNDGGGSGIVPSQPMSVPEHRICEQHDDLLAEFAGLEHNSYEAPTLSASPPLTRENLQLLAHTVSHADSNDLSLTNGRPSEPARTHEGMLMGINPDVEDDMPDFETMSLEDSVAADPGQRSLSMSMISDFSHAFTRSSPNASALLSGMRHIYIHTPLPLVAECNHATTNRRCGCYCRM